MDLDCNLELGDIIEIHATDNKEFDKQTFFIVYIDEKDQFNKYSKYAKFYIKI